MVRKAVARIFKADFLENRVSSEKILFFILDLFFLYVL